MLQPRQLKFKKFRKGRIKQTVSKQSASKYTMAESNLKFGHYGLCSMEGTRITARQIEAARRVIRRKLKRHGKLWICIFPDTPVTGKPTEVRMGKGKGAVAYWAARVKPGQVLFELSGVPKTLAKSVLMSASKKFAINTKFIERPKPL